MMRRVRAFIAVALAAVVAVCAVNRIPRPLVPTGGTLFVSGYHPWWSLGSPSGYPVDLMDQVFLFEWEVGPEGRVKEFRGWPEAWVSTVDSLVDSGTGVVPTVTLFGVDDFESVFGDAGRYRRLSEELVALTVADPRLSGLHLDVEVFDPVSPQAREGYTAFVQETAAALRERMPEMTLSTFLPALDYADAYDEVSIAAASDYAVVQGYDLHYRTGPEAGEVSPLSGWGGLNLAAVAGRYREMEIPGVKLLLGLPMYGYEWPTETNTIGSTTRGGGVTVPLHAPPAVESELPRALDRAREYGVQRFGEGQTPWYAFEADDGWYQGWYDDGVSLAIKVEFAREAGFGGIAFFPLTYGTPESWDQLRDALR